MLVCSLSAASFLSSVSYTDACFLGLSRLGAISPGKPGARLRVQRSNTAQASFMYSSPQARRKVTKRRRCDNNNNNTSISPEKRLKAARRFRSPSS